MDPLAHTLAGATLAETGLRRASPLATATLILGANAPDIDAIAQLAGTDAALYWRRGHTHGVLAMAVLPVALTGLMWLWDRAVRRRPGLPPIRPLRLWALAQLAILSHPALDWLNSYGVRFLMPFDGTWFYGDVMFIVDPWIWLLLGAPVVVARTGRWPGAVAAAVLAGAATWAVLANERVPPGAKLAWGVGLALIVALRAAARVRAPRVAVACAATVVAYIGAALASKEVARADAAAWLAERGVVAAKVVAGPVLANPFRRELIARAGDRYLFVERAFLGEPAMRFVHDPVPLGPRDAVTAAALAAPSVRGMRSWIRLPSFAVARDAGGPVVTLEDVRYSRRGARIGTAVVRLDEAHRPR